MQVKVEGTVLQIFELAPYFPISGIIGGRMKGKRWLAVWVAGVGFVGGLLRDLMISKLVPKSGIAHQYEY